MNLSSTRSPRGSERGAIYVVRLNLRVSYDPVRFEMGWKVGFTQNLPMRINTLMGIHRPGELVAVTLGTRDDEARFHTELSSACKFAAMLTAGVTPTEHVPSQAFWANARKAVRSLPVLAEERDARPCECVL